MPAQGTPGGNRTTSSSDFNIASTNATVNAFLRARHRRSYLAAEAYQVEPATSKTTSSQGCIKTVSNQPLCSLPYARTDIHELPFPKHYDMQGAQQHPGFVEEQMMRFQQQQPYQQQSLQQPLQAPTLLGQHSQHQSPLQPPPQQPQNVNQQEMCSQQLTQTGMRARSNTPLGQTFSIIGSHTGKELKVVSREPLAPDAPPINAPQLPLMINEAAKRKAEEHERETASLNWSYICEVSGYKGTMPDHPAIRHLLSLPRVRELKLVGQLKSNPDIRQIGAMVVQITSISHQKKCTTCRRNGTGPFDTCVNSANKHVEDLRLLFGSSHVRACGNCIYLKVASFCSVKKTPANLLATKAPRASNEGNGIYAASGSSGVDAKPVDDDYYSMMNVLNRRRPRRIEESDGNDIELQDEASVDNLHPAAKRRRQENSSGAEGKAPALHKSIMIPDSDAPSPKETVDPAVLGEDIEIEDWEQGGRILTTAPACGKPGASSNNEELAFSSRYLMPGSGSYQRQGRTIQVSKGVSFLATHIPSGSIHKFEPDKTKMRICTLANGKLRVTVDGEPEFVISANGVFKLSPGKGCKILNRAYVDVVLYVTSVEGAM